jgi:hypothetical protein
VLIASCGDSAIIWSYSIWSLGERVIESLLEKYLYIISRSLSRF